MADADEVAVSGFDASAAPGAEVLASTNNESDCVVLCESLSDSLLYLAFALRRRQRGQRCAALRSAFRGADGQLPVS